MAARLGSAAWGYNDVAPQQAPPLSVVDMVRLMTYAMSGPAVIVHVLVEIAASLERQLPDVGSRRIIRSVQSAHRVASVLLPDLAAYATAVRRLAQATATDVA